MKLTNAQKVAHNLKLAQLIKARVNDPQVVNSYVRSLGGK